MKCPICGKDFDSVDCLHWGPDLIKIIERVKEFCLEYYKSPFIKNPVERIKEILEGKQ